MSSFSPLCLQAAREAAPTCPRALIVGRGELPSWLRNARSLGAVAVHVAAHLIETRTADALHAAGLALGAYTINGRPLARGLFARVVDYVFTDRPDRLRSLGSRASG